MNDFVIDVFENVGVLVSAAIAVTGTIQWLKNFFKAIPTKVWAVALVVLSIGFSFLPPVIRNGLLIAAIAQLGYEKLIQPVTKRL